jgi:CBS domain-containing protein
VLEACIYFDLRPLGGTIELGTALSAIVRAEAPEQRAFLGYLARDVVTRRLPVTMFGNIAVQRSGPQRGAVDIKGAGGLQLVGAARLYSLALALGETNTVDRVRASAGRGLFKEAEAREITDAFQHLMRLRLVHQLEQIARGEAPDNFIAPGLLSRADALLLRDAMKTVARVQAGVRERFATDFVAG